MDHENCCPHSLARGEIGEVTVCAGCGQVHLNLQYLTLRFEPGAFLALAAMVDQARSGLERLASAPAAAATAAPAPRVH